MKFLSFETVLLLTLTFAKCVGNFHALSAYSSLMLLRLRPNAQYLPKAIPKSMMFEFLSFSHPPLTSEEQRRLHFLCHGVFGAHK